MILTGPFQLGIFYESLSLYYRNTTVSIKSEFYAFLV